MICTHTFNNQKSVEIGMREMKINKSIIKKKKRIIVKRSLEGLCSLRVKVEKLIFFLGDQKK
jgi:hypothetical protein